MKARQNMDDPKKHTEDDETLRRRLKESQHVKASPDFEARLQRRLNEARKVSSLQALLEKLGMQPRFPAYGYSIVTVLLVSVVSYYVFFRSGIAPRQESPLPVVAEKSVPSAKAPENVEELDRLQVKKESDASNALNGKAKRAEEPVGRFRDKEEQARAQPEDRQAPSSIAAPSQPMQNVAPAMQGQLESKDENQPTVRLNAVGVAEHDTAANMRPLESATVPGQASQQEQLMQKQVITSQKAVGPHAVHQDRKTGVTLRRSPAFTRGLRAGTADSLRTDSLRTISRTADSLARVKRHADSLLRLTDSLKSIRSKKED